MANTTMVENTKGIATATIFFTGCCITIFANVVMIALILWKRQLWQVRFYIISNLAVSDIMTLLMLASTVVRRIYQDYHIALDTKVNISFIVPRVIGVASRINSLLTLVFLAFEISSNFDEEEGGCCSSCHLAFPFDNIWNDFDQCVGLFRISP